MRTILTACCTKTKPMDAQRTKQKSKLGTVLDKYTLLDYRTI